MQFGSAPGRRIPMLTPTCSKRAPSLSNIVVEAELAFEPAQVARVDDEPPLAGEAEPGLRALERSLRNHAL